MKRRKELVIVIILLFLLLLGFFQIHNSSKIIQKRDINKITNSKIQENSDVTTIAATNKQEENNNVNINEDDDDELGTSSIMKKPSSIAVITSALGLHHSMKASTRDAHSAILHRASDFIRNIYCEHHGYSYILVGDAFDKKKHRSLAWSKLAVLLEEMENENNNENNDGNNNKKKRISWYVFMSIDSLIMDFEQHLESIIAAAPKSAHFIISSRVPGGRGRSRSTPLVETSVFFVKNSKWSRKFLSRVFNEIGNDYFSKCSSIQQRQQEESSTISVPPNKELQGALTCAILLLSSKNNNNNNNKDNENKLDEDSGKVFIVHRQRVFNSFYEGFQEVESTNNNKKNNLPAVRDAERILYHPGDFIASFPHCAAASSSSSSTFSHVQQSPFCTTFFMKAFHKSLELNHISENFESTAIKYERREFRESSSVLLGTTAASSSSENDNNNQKQKVQNLKIYRRYAIFSYLRHSDIEHAGETIVDGTVRRHIIDSNKAKLHLHNKVLREAFCKQQQQQQLEEESNNNNDNDNGNNNKKKNIVVDCYSEVEPLSLSRADTKTTTISSSSQRSNSWMWSKLLEIVKLKKYDYIIVLPHDAMITGAQFLKIDNENKNKKKNSFFDIERDIVVNRVLFNKIDNRNKISDNNDDEEDGSNNDNDHEKAKQEQIRSTLANIDVILSPDFVEYKNIGDIFIVKGKKSRFVSKFIAQAAAPPSSQTKKTLKKSRKSNINNNNDVTSVIDSLLSDKQRSELHQHVTVVQNNDNNNQIRGEKDNDNQQQQHSGIFIAKRQRAFNSYIFPTDDKRPPVRHVLGVDFIGRFYYPNCEQQQQQQEETETAIKHCFSAAERLFQYYSKQSNVVKEMYESLINVDYSTSLLKSSRIVSSSSYSSLEADDYDEQQQQQHQQSNSLFEKQLEISAIKSIFEKDGELIDANNKMKKYYLQQQQQITLPPRSYKKSSEVAVLVVVCPGGSNRISSIELLQKWHLKTFESKVSYASRHDYNLIVEDCSISVGAADDSGWSILLSTKKYLEPPFNYEKVLFSDVTTIIMDQTKAVEDIEGVFEAKHQGDAPLTLVLSRDADGASAAMMLWRRTKATSDLLSVLFNTVKRKSMCQDVNNLVQYGNHHDQNKANSKNKRQLAVIQGTFLYERGAIRCLLHHHVNKNLQVQNEHNNNLDQQQQQQQQEDSNFNKHMFSVSQLVSSVGIAPKTSARGHSNLHSDDAAMTKALSSIPQQLLVALGHEELQVKIHNIKSSRHFSPFRFVKGDFAVHFKHCIAAMQSSERDCFQIVDDFVLKSRKWNGNRKLERESNEDADVLNPFRPK